jgi:hypothetical protein
MPGIGRDGDGQLVRGAGRSRPALHMQSVVPRSISRSPASGEKWASESAGPRDRIHPGTVVRADEWFATVTRALSQGTRVPLVG